ncbi:MAG: hypothetical protein V6Z81_08870 [Parvularculales bacterium]
MNKAILKTVLIGSLLIGCSSTNNSLSGGSGIQAQSWAVVFDPQSADPQARSNNLDSALTAALSKGGRLVLEHCPPMADMGVFADNAIRQHHESRILALQEWFRTRGVDVEPIIASLCGESDSVSFVLSTL